MIPSSQLAALKWLRNRNGDGVFDRNHVLVAGGERAPVMRATWNKLEVADLVEFYHDRRRLRVTDAGKLADVSRVEESA
ncbi:hypothetical protein [Mesorhizobium sp.]|uniref:hypothetical protein n=1 Tax=Mesorhizobium sp. TaxID=1871066 RepID=UPI000FE7D65A|nr:hypothetical protein [Mesorhizobium sp.]RWO90901.1 MAG: hypothetical protein EOQ95_13575 [Mesorhizobium sp.]